MHCGWPDDLATQQEGDRGRQGLTKLQQGDAYQTSYNTQANGGRGAHEHIIRKLAVSSVDEMGLKDIASRSATCSAAWRELWSTSL